MFLAFDIVTMAVVLLFYVHCSYSHYVLEFVFGLVICLVGVNLTEELRVYNYIMSARVRQKNPSQELPFGIMRLAE